jgi:sulfur carrier protein ThiS
MRRFAPAGANEFEIELEAGAQVGHLLDQLGVPAANQAMVAVNGARAERDRPLNDGDTIVLFTPAEGG